jgi:hypothetical protein
MPKDDKPPLLSAEFPSLRFRIRPPAPANADPVAVRLEGAEGLDHLTQSSKTHLEIRLRDFTVQVVAEAKAIEQREHAGKGPPEVTAAHVDEAWWVVRRRIRRARHPILTLLARAFETFGAAGIGVGASLFQARWGPTVFMASCLITMSAFLLEAFLVKD